MKKTRLNYLSLLFVLGFLFSCAEKTNQSKVEDDFAAIEKLCDDYAKYAMVKDLDSFMTCFADDATRAEPGKPPIVGKDRIRERFEAMWAEPGEFTLKRQGDLNAEICGDKAYSFGIFTLSSTLPDSTTSHIDMNVLSILKKLDDGSWKLYIDCINFHPSWNKDTIPEELLQENDPYY